MITTGTIIRKPMIRGYNQSSIDQSIERLWPYLRPQRVFTGSGAIENLKLASATSKPFIVTDIGLKRAGLAINLQKSHFPDGKIEIHDAPTPTGVSLFKLYESFKKSDHDSIMGFGGGGPMDAAKSVAWLSAIEKVNPSEYSVTSSEKVDNMFHHFNEIMNRIISSPTTKEAYTVPKLLMVPTTAGTGSDGGKSLVISLLDGSKKVLGHPSLIAPYVALDPSQTISLPARVTAATAVDALAHLMEAYFVKDEVAMRKDPSLTLEEASLCDEFAICGLDLVLENLPTALIMPEHLQTRKNLQIAALFGAKAFRKGDLGAIHATAHSLASHCHHHDVHLHHGECIGRMFIPALSFNEPRADGVTKAKFEKVKGLFEKHGHKGDTLVDSVKSFLTTLNLPQGLEGLTLSKDLKTSHQPIITEKLDVEAMAKDAYHDSCNTNPVPMTIEDFKVIFQNAL